MKTALKRAQDQGATAEEVRRARGPRPRSKVEREVHAALEMAWEQTRHLREREAEAERVGADIMQIRLR